MSAQSFKDNVVNVASASTYDFYLKVVDELAKMYEDAGLELRKMHSGGDEVAEGAWTASPQAKKLLESLPEISDPKNLQTYFLVPSWISWRIGTWKCMCGRRWYC